MNYFKYNCAIEKFFWLWKIYLIREDRSKDDLLRERNSYSKEELFEWKIIIDRWEVDINWNVRCSTRNRIKLIEFYYHGTKVKYIYISISVKYWSFEGSVLDIKIKTKLLYKSRLVFQVISNLIFHKKHLCAKQREAVNSFVVRNIQYSVTILLLNSFDEKFSEANALGIRYLQRHTRRNRY